MKINELVEKALSEPNCAVSLYLMTSYLYYCRYESVISDTDFDNICKFMLTNYDEIDHMHKHLVPKDSLTAGTGFHLKESDYPLIVKHSSEILLKEFNTERNMTER